LLRRNFFNPAFFYHLLALFCAFRYFKDAQLYIIFFSSNIHLIDVKIEAVEQKSKRIF